ncbi:MAG TPA: Rv0909 family putative TA system antitoxin [Candidatus Limnocylindrales bacterium]|nr:Rv0909 family putative TA system antitoxin [Candidatus Limnocylindrales bacterium]
MERGDSQDIRALMHETAEVYLGHTETLDQLVTGITGLAQEDPGQARQLVESIAAAADDATGGRHTEEIDSVEQLALKTLGLHAHAVVHKPEQQQEGEKQ